MSALISAMSVSRNRYWLCRLLNRKAISSKLGVQMLGTQVMMRADDRPLEKRPHALDGVGVDIGLHPFLRPVVNRSVLSVLVADARTLEPRLAGR